MFGHLLEANRYGLEESGMTGASSPFLEKNRSLVCDLLSGAYLLLGLSQLKASVAPTAVSKIIGVHGGGDYGKRQGLEP